MKSIFKWVLGFIIFTTIVSGFLLLKNKEQQPNSFEEVYQPYCGNASEAENNPDAQKGKQIFNSNCAACHKLDARSTGPALRDISRKYSKYHMHLNNFLQGKRDAHLLMSPTESDTLRCPLFPNLTDKDVASLEAYTH